MTAATSIDRLAAVDPSRPALLELQDVYKSFRAGGWSQARRHAVRAVVGVTLAVHAGEAVGLIGESGSGKTTVARITLGLVRPDRGKVLFSGRDLARARERELRVARREMHMVFQDPYESLSPRMQVSSLVAEPLLIHGVPSADRPRLVLDALAESGLAPPEDFARRYPNELSGGQRQRVALARALVLRPRLIVADEPTSMLDVSIRASLLATIRALRAEHGIALLFITHDLAVARSSCDHLAVMFRGTIVESGPTDEVLTTPRHPYTVALRQAVRDLAPPDPVPPSGLQPTGCLYRDRCPRAQDACAQTPQLLHLDPTHAVACHFPMPAPPPTNERNIRP